MSCGLGLVKLVLKVNIEVFRVESDRCNTSARLESSRGYMVGCIAVEP
jgi:hypothetical protein